MSSLKEWWRRRRQESLRRRLVYSAKSRCACGAGFAYDKRTSHTVWDCSAIILGDALLGGEASAAVHSNPCTYFEMLSERHPAAQGATTRPA
ncbi:hypothetical protein [Protaetiibacter mangrovi]|uniref:Uncharacterized protein n=1 Tax=Protaetiibacter mangrovi TaxID=2970926 RepID=A0ABT1ZCW3_9MICO|nr:hypothetical protein [Protaetiibacter mangrovi]MCS0498558.1 hypothetical protein [Protaetiibacter mangrovi]TPW92990.1 hypothetical protein FJ656_35095 [Schumannella luteola]